MTLPAWIDGVTFAALYRAERGRTDWQADLVIRAQGVGSYRYPDQDGGTIRLVSVGTLPGERVVVTFEWKETDGPERGAEGIETLVFQRAKGGGVDFFGSYFTYDRELVGREWRA